uniref:Uncharacterized protein n=1 Tax=viral metagenome TaxID=1070528 RepID=A0A6M3LIQ7_9ZZZZ
MSNADEILNGNTEKICKWMEEFYKVPLTTVNRSFIRNELSIVWNSAQIEILREQINKLTVPSQIS